MHSLCDFISRHRRLFVLTGAGCSTDSDITVYRDASGNWKRSPPVSFQAFMGSEAVRQRYWARSLVGWQRFRRAAPNGAHAALARLEQQNRLEVLVTQNIDGLHQAAGSTWVVDLHGRLDRVRCMDCYALLPRQELQDELLRCNFAWSRLEGVVAPDGDADIEGLPFDEFAVPSCSRCNGVLKPDAVLVVGSSLMVYSGYRFVQAAAQAGKPVAAINLGRTRADGLLALKVSEPCASALGSLPTGYYDTFPAVTGDNNASVLLGERC